MTQRQKNFKEFENCVVLYPDNYINDIEGDRLEDLCGGFLKKGVRKIVIDFSSTDIINSIGVSVLIGIIERVRDNGGTVLFSGLKPVNTRIFDIVGLTKHIRVFSTEDEALGQERASQAAF